MKSLEKISKKIIETQIQGLIKPKIIPKTAKIGHFGVGAFHRAHQALYTQLGMQATNDDSWGIIGVGIMPFDKKMTQLFKEQDFLYSLTQKSVSGEINTRLMCPILDYVYAPNDLPRAVQILSAEDISVITLTITQGGYFIRKGQFDITNPVIVEEINSVKTDKIPSTVYGYLARILDKRMNTHGKGLTILSCDNIQHNGDLTAKGLGSFLIKANPELLNWTKQKCTFPNSMVDRITPQFALKDKEYINGKFNLNDQIPVVCEDFIQWIIQDNFALSRPPWDKGGATFVKDVTPYEKMKLRILNGSHQALCYVGSLQGYKFVHEAVQDQIITNFVLKYVKQEVIQTLDEVPGVDLNSYTGKVIERFQNRQILDTLSRICEFTSDRIPLFNVPATLWMTKNKKPTPLSAMIVASWIVYIERSLQKDTPFKVVDNRKEQIIKAVEKIKEGENPSQFLNLHGMFDSLKNNESFCADLQKSYKSLKINSVSDALKEII